MNKILFLPLFIILLFSCNKAGNINKWIGCYIYEEKPVKALNEKYYQIMTWRLSFFTKLTPV